MVLGTYTGKKIIVSKENKSQFIRKYFGTDEDGPLELSPEEAFFLIKKGDLELVDKENKKIGVEKFIKLSTKNDKRFWARACVLSDLRRKGYIVKTALKYGADFRVYDKGEKPGEEHARWILFAITRHENLTPETFAAMGRIAHSVKKSLLLGIVDDEDSVTYYEINWRKM